MRGKHQRSRRYRQNLRDVERTEVKYNEVQKISKADKQQWFDDKAKEAENAANTGDSKRLFDIVKELTGHSIQRTQLHKTMSPNLAVSHSSV